MTEIIVDGGVSEPEITAVDFGRFSCLKSLKIGDHCFSYVEKVKLVGLKMLESVVIEMESFTKRINDHGNDPNRHFVLKNCPSLKKLEIGYDSFSDYTVCEIEKVDALETISIGPMDGIGACFYSASLELKSEIVESER